jgi:Crinkler effector protein N-terminal domain
MKIYCYVRGDLPQDVFTIDIGDEETVDELSKAIKEETRPRFDGVRSLRLWEVSVPLDRKLKNAVEALNLHVDESLFSTDILSEIFPDLAKKSVHVVIDRPRSGEL